MSSAWKKLGFGRIVWFRPDRFTLFLASLAVLGVVLVLLHEVTYGATLEWDSVTYIAVARNLLAGNGFVQPYDGNYYTHWPPLFPGLLALGRTARPPGHAAALRPVLTVAVWPLWPGLRGPGQGGHNVRYHL